MANISKEVQNEKYSEEHLLNLCEAMTFIKTVDDARGFLMDLCTISEVRAFAERWHVAELLFNTDLSYREINQRTGVSTATIGRVARFLNDEPYKGYKSLLKQTKKKRK